MAFPPYPYAPYAGFPGVNPYFPMPIAYPQPFASTQQQPPGSPSKSKSNSKAKQGHSCAGVCNSKQKLKKDVTVNDLLCHSVTTTPDPSGSGLYFCNSHGGQLVLLNQHGLRLDGSGRADLSSLNPARMAYAHSLIQQKASERVRKEQSKPVHCYCNYPSKKTAENGIQYIEACNRPVHKAGVTICRYHEMAETRRKNRISGKTPSKKGSAHYPQTGPLSYAQQGFPFQPHPLVQSQVQSQVQPQFQPQVQSQVQPQSQVQFPFQHQHQQPQPQQPQQQQYSFYQPQQFYQPYQQQQQQHQFIENKQQHVPNMNMSNTGSSLSLSSSSLSSSSAAAAASASAAGGSPNAYRPYMGQIQARPISPRIVESNSPRVIYQENPNSMIVNTASSPRFPQNVNGPSTIIHSQ